MANFFDGLVNIAKHPLDEAQFLFDVGRGKTSLKNAPGKHQEMMNDITVPLLGDNKISKNSDAVAGAIVGGILAAPMIAGGGGASGGSSGSLFNLGDVGGYFKPSTAFGESAGSSFQGMGTPSFDISQGAGWKPGGAELDLGSSAYTPTTEFGGAKAAKGVDWDAVARMMQSIKPQEEQRISHSGRGGGGFRFDRKPYENELLTREYMALYNQPLYNKLG